MTAPDPVKTTGEGSDTSLFGAMGALGGTNALAFGAGIVRQKIFAVYLGAAGYGRYAIAMALFELLTTLGLLGAPNGLLRVMSERLGSGRKDEAREVLRQVRRWLMIWSGVIALAVILLADVIVVEMIGLEIPRWTIILLAVAVPLTVGAGLAEAGINALGKIRWLAGGKVGVTLLSLAVMVVLVMRMGLVGAIVQIATGAFIGFVVSGFLLRRAVAGMLPRHESTPSRALPAGVVRTVLAIGVAHTVHGALAAGNKFLFRLLITADLGAFDTGLYQGAMGMSAQYLGAVASGVFVFLYPRLSRARSSEEFGASLSGALSAVAVPSLAAAFVLLASRSWIVDLLFTSEFVGMIPLMAVAFVTDFFQLTARILHMSILARGRPVVYLVTGLVVELFHLAAFYVLLDATGLLGGILAYGASSLVGLAVYGSWLQRSGNLSLPGRTLLRWALGGVALIVFALLVPPTLPGLGLAVILGGAWLLVSRDAIREGLAG